jgi:hypothetical protein
VGASYKPTETVGEPIRHHKAEVSAEAALKPGPAGAFEQKVTVLRVMVTQTLFASCDAACTPVKVKMHRGLIWG